MARLYVAPTDSRRTVTAISQPGSEGKPVGGTAQQRVAASLAQARQNLIRNNGAAALSLLKEIANMPECPAEQRLEAAKMLSTAGANSDAAQCYLNAGLGFLYDHGDMTRARQAFASAHNADPHNLDVIFHLGQADVVEGRTQDGLAKFIDVLRKSNLKHTPALFEAGCIYQANGQYDQAILAFKKVIDREKNHIQAIVHMGQLHQIKGMVPEAITYYMQAAAITREANQLGTTRQIVNMVLAIDGNNQRARAMLADLTEPEEEELPEPAQPAVTSKVAARKMSPVEPTPEETLAAETAAAAAQAADDAQTAKQAQARDDVKASQATLAQLRDERESTAKAVTQLRAQSAGAVQVQAEQQAALSALAEQRANVEAELARVRAELEAAAQQLESAQAQVKQREHDSMAKAATQLRAQNAGAAQAQAEQQAAISALAEQRAGIEAELARVRSDFQAAAKQLESAQAQAKLSEQEKGALAAVIGQRDQAQRELAQLNAQSERARAENDEALATQAAISKATAELDERLQALQGQVEQAEARRQSAHGEAAASVSELERKGRALKAQVVEEERKLAQAREQAASMQSSVANSKTAHEAAMLEIAARRQRAQAELDKIVAEVDSTAKRKDAEHARAELSVAQLEKKAEQMRAELAAAESRRKELDAKTSANQAALKALDERVAKAEAKSQTAASDLKDIVDQAHSAQENSTLMSATLAELALAIEAAQSRKRALEESIGKVKPLAAVAEKRRSEFESAAELAEKTKIKCESELRAIEAKKREAEDAFAKSKSLITAAERRRAEADAAAEQAEALRAKREADAQALAARVATLEATLHDGEARAKASAAEGASLVELSAKVNAQRNAVLELEATKSQTERAVAELHAQLESTRKTLEEAQSAFEAQPRTLPQEAAVQAEALAAVVSPESCVESLRTIESLASEGELTMDVATELAGLIHEGRAPYALREARKYANLEAAPASFLLVSGDLCRDLGDIAGAREAYKTLALAAPQKSALAHSRMGDLFLSFAERSTSAALQRDDAHFAATSDPAKAIETYADLVARFPEDPNFREELGALHERLGNDGAAALAYTQAMVGYLGSDDVARAAELAPRMLAVHPNSGAAYELASRAFDRAGHRPDAKSALDQALRCFHESQSAADVERVCRRLAEIADDPVPYRRELSMLLREAGDISGAAEQLLEAAETLVGWSRGADAQQLLKEVAALASDDEMVEERLAALGVRAVDAQKSVDDVARGDLLVSKGQYERAAESYRRALDENPHHSGAAYQLACLLMDHFADNETAEALLQMSADQRPGHAATRYRLALVKAARGRVVEAVELLIALARFDEANADFIELFAERLEKDAESGDVAAKYRLGLGLRELGRADEALVILQSIQRETDYVVLCHNAIGLCLRRQGLDTAAAKRFTKAIETPGYPESQYHEAFYNLGELYEAKDTPESLALALSSFEELYASDCTFKDVADRIKSVKMRMGATERPKVKRLPTRSVDRG